MAKKSQLKSSAKQIESLTHNEAKRKNIPTAEYQSVLQKEKQSRSASLTSDATAT